MRMERLLHLEWDAIAGVIAAVTAIALELLHPIQSEVLLALTVALIALLFSTRHAPRRNHGAFGGPARDSPGESAQNRSGSPASRCRAHRAEPDPQGKHGVSWLTPAAR